MIVLYSRAGIKFIFATNRGGGAGRVRRGGGGVNWQSRTRFRRHGVVRILLVVQVKTEEEQTGGMRVPTDDIFRTVAYD